MSGQDDLADEVRLAQRRERQRQKRETAGIEPKPHPITNGHDDDEATIHRLAAMRALEYERVREAEAERLGCRVGMLDRLVSRERGDGVDIRGLGRPLDLPSPEAWPSPVNGIGAVVHARAVFRSSPDPTDRRASCDGAVDAAQSLLRRVRFHPRLQFKAPTKNAGKSTAMALLHGVVPRALEPRASRKPSYIAPSSLRDPRC